MKIRLLPLALFAALLAAGCGKKDTAPSTSASSPAPASTAPAAAAPRVIEIAGNDQMQFVIGDKRSGPTSNLVIEAKAGEELKVVLKNVGTLPKEAMGHNWVLLTAGADGMAFSTAAVAAKATEYIPESHKAQVIAATKLIGPRETAEVTFKVPAAGEYPFICSFPAHYAVGMKGMLVAK
jgi:azurin